MDFLEAVEARVRGIGGTVCSVYKILKSLEDSDPDFASQLVKALSLEHISPSQIAAELRARGINVTTGTVSRHRLAN